MLYTQMQELLRGVSCRESQEILEAIVDYIGVKRTTLLLADICQEKATFVQETWQDNPLARQWSHDASVLNKVSEKINN